MNEALEFYDIIMRKLKAIEKLTFWRKSGNLGLAKLGDYKNGNYQCH